jgi:ribonuclease Z
MENNSTQISPQSESRDDSVEVWKIWNVRPPYPISGSTYTLKGYSIAALRTNFYIRELGIMLDAGLSSPNMLISHIFLTHSHSDHCANIPFHIYSKQEDVPIQIYAPKEISGNLKSFIESAYMLSSHVDIEELKIKREELYVHGYFKITPVSAGDIIDLVIKNKKLSVEIIQCVHSVPCVGFGFSEKRLKLKDEYKSLSGKEIGELRKKGENINVEQTFPIFCFIGDTGRKIFEIEWERIKKYKTIIIECTFIRDEDLPQADKTFHMHWNYIKDIVIENPDNIFVLYHFSMRYGKSELTEFFDKLNIKNVVPWIN